MRRYLETTMERTDPKKQSPEHRRKVGLALGGGAAKGFSHIGVIKALEASDIPIDVVSGTSIGALFGGWYAATKNIADIEAVVRKTDWRTLISWREFSPRRTGAMFNTEKLAAFLRKNLADPSIESLPIPCAVIATDIRTGKEFRFEKGNLVTAILASIAVPGIFPAVEYEGHLLVDGGLSNPVPFDAAHALGAERVIGVDLSSDYILESGKIFEKGFWRPWQFFNIIYTAFSVIEHQIAELKKHPDDILLRPRISHIHPAAFHKVEEGIQAGEDEVKTERKLIFEKTGIPEKERTAGEKLVDFLLGD